MAMTQTVEINSLSINKLKNSHENFSKYNIEIALDETENSDDAVILKYQLTLLSNPTNIKIHVDGMVSIHGDETEITKQLEVDQKNIPVVVNAVYQEIFPLFYIISKNMHIPCPAHRLAHISQSTFDDDTFKAQVGTETDKTDSIKTPDVEPANDASDEVLGDVQSEPSESTDEQVIEPSVSPN